MIRSGTPIANAKKIIGKYANLGEDCPGRARSVRCFESDFGAEVVAVMKPPCVRRDALGSRQLCYLELEFEFRRKPGMQ